MEEIIDGFWVNIEKFRKEILRDYLKLQRILDLEDTLLLLKVEILGEK